MIDNSLLMGIVLIGVGIALALIAYAVLLNRREGEETATPDEQEAEGPDMKESREPAPLPAPPSTPPAASRPAAPSAVPPPPAPIEPPPGVAWRRLLPVATLFREEVTGDLVIQVGERTYRRVEDLQTSPDANRVRSAASDLARWLARGPAPAKAAGAVRDEGPAKPGSMIEQINMILEEKLSSTSSATRGIRLAEGPGGVVRVFIGVVSYTMDEVPDPEVRQLIRQAVAEWEARG